mmetsp:Transcript_14391/g.23935  ORF Transcript_14391/g.23935 Transcript_14391/m.23935 type:complete len:80 (+) Transcript_14391:156-395(+)
MNEFVMSLFLVMGFIHKHVKFKMDSLPWSVGIAVENKATSPQHGVHEHHESIHSRIASLLLRRLLVQRLILTLPWHLLQ